MAPPCPLDHSNTGLLEQVVNDVTIKNLALYTYTMTLYESNVNNTWLSPRYGKQHFK